MAFSNLLNQVDASYFPVFVQGLLINSHRPVCIDLPGHAAPIFSILGGRGLIHAHSDCDLRSVP